MNEFNGVFDGDDMVAAGAVGFVDDGGQGGGLAAAGGAGDDDQPARQTGQFGHDRGQAELITAHDRRRDFAENRPDPVFLHKKIGPVTGQTWNLIAEIGITGLFKKLDFIFSGYFIEHGAQFVIFQHLVFDPFDVTVDTQGRRLAGHKVQVGCILLMHQFEKGINFCHGQLLKWVNRISGQTEAVSEGTGHLVPRDPIIPSQLIIGRRRREV